MRRLPILIKDFHDFSQSLQKKKRLKYYLERGHYRLLSYLSQFTKISCKGVVK
jgi:hypothetical protein